MGVVLSVNNQFHIHLSHDHVERYAMQDGGMHKLARGIEDKLSIACAKTTPRISNMI